MEVTLDTNISEAERQLIQDQVVAYSDVKSSPRNFKNISAVLRDESNAVVAGVVGLIVWDWLAIDLLWVAEQLRGKGHGSRLMLQIETNAIALGCTNSRLDTFDFEAKDFYLKCGYHVYASLKEFPRGHTQFHMQKKLRDG